MWWILFRFLWYSQFKQYKASSLRDLSQLTPIKAEAFSVEAHPVLTRFALSHSPLQIHSPFKPRNGEIRMLHTRDARHFNWLHSCRIRRPRRSDIGRASESILSWVDITHCWSEFAREDCFKFTKLMEFLVTSPKPDTRCNFVDTKSSVWTVMDNS